MLAHLSKLKLDTAIEVIGHHRKHTGVFMFCYRWDNDKITWPQLITGFPLGQFIWISQFEEDSGTSWGMLPETNSLSWAEGRSRYSEDPLQLIAHLTALQHKLLHQKTMGKIHVCKNVRLASVLWMTWQTRREGNSRRPRLDLRLLADTGGDTRSNNCS